MNDRQCFVFIKLRLASFAEEVHIDVSRIHALHRTKITGLGDVTNVYVGPVGENIFTVVERPEEIFAQINEVFAKFNAAGTLTMPRKELVDLTLVWRHETEKAIAVSLDEDGEWIWLAKHSEQRPIEYERRSPGRLVDVTLPSWLAQEKGLI